MAKSSSERLLALHELSTSALTLTEATMRDILKLMAGYNQRLIELHDEIRQVQPVANGSVCLELYKCGKGCSGCPHFRWVKYHWKEQRGDKKAPMIAINLSKQGLDPILALTRKTAHFEATATLIREAKYILEKRRKLTLRIRNLSYSLT